jgi:hypothetical protein
MQTDFAARLSAPESLSPWGRKQIILPSDQKNLRQIKPLEPGGKLQLSGDQCTIDVMNKTVAQAASVNNERSGANGGAPAQRGV